jgi:hypothetical protein
MVALCTALGAWVYWAEGPDRARVASFCDQARVGDSIAALDALSEAQGAQHWSRNIDSSHKYTFNDWGIYECWVDTDGDRIVSTRLYSEAFD